MIATSAMRWVALCSLLVLAGLRTESARAAEEAPTTLRLLVPAYFYPAGEGLKQWERLLAARAPVVAVVNPANGPGDKADPNYQKVFAAARRSEAVLIGYVDTNYAKRTAAAVKADIDRWTRLYPGVAGIFFDQQNSGTDFVEYYARLYQYVRKERKLRLVVTNPGTACAQEYFTAPATDVGVLFEGPQGPDRFKLPAWAEKFSSRVCVLVYKVPDAEDMAAGIAAAAKNKIGYVFLTDGALPNPWDHLPPYWDAMVTAVREANRGR